MLMQKSAETIAGTGRGRRAGAGHASGACRKKCGKSTSPRLPALVEVLRAIKNHPAVAWCERRNSGAQVVEGTAGRRFKLYGFKDCPDVLGMLKNGRLLACEVKAPGGRLRPEQAAFLELVRAAGDQLRTGSQTHGM